MATRPRTLTDDAIASHADVVRLGRLPGASRQAQAAAERAKAALAETYMPLAANLAERYVPKLGRDEARSAAYLGLTLALRSWDPDKGALPSWIRLYCKNALLREVDKQNLIKLPQEVAPKRAMLLHLRAQGLDDECIAQRIKVDESALDELANAPSVSVWLDSKVVEEDYDEEQPNEAAILANTMLSQLPTNERVVMEARFGIGHDGLCHSYDEIAKLTSLDTPTVQAIEARALAMLRALSSQAV